MILEVLVRREPELARLLSEATAVKDEGGESFCANKVWYIYFEPQLKEIIGRRAKEGDPLFRTQEAYDLSHRNIYKLLPNCRNCVCVPW